MTETAPLTGLHLIGGIWVGGGATFLSSPAKGTGQSFASGGAAAPSRMPISLTTHRCWNGRARWHPPCWTATRSWPKSTSPAGWAGDWTTSRPDAARRAYFLVTSEHQKTTAASASNKRRHAAKYITL